MALTGWTSWKEFKGLSGHFSKEQVEEHFPHNLLECQSLKKEEEKEAFKVVLNEFLTKIVYPNCTIFKDSML